MQRSFSTQSVARSLPWLAALCAALLPATAPAADSTDSLTPGIEGPFVTKSGVPGRNNVDLRTLPIVRWQPGDPVLLRLEDLAERPQPITPEAYAEALAYQDPLVAQQRATAGGGGGGSGAVPQPIVDVAGITSGFFPPDIVGDVGPNHYIQSVNASRIQVFDKQGNTLAGPFDLDSLWTAGGSCASGIGDPIVLYDGLADRWMLSEFASGNRLCIYISQGANPVTSGWFLYDFPTPSFPDYPKYGIWPNAYLVTSFEGVLGAYALDRTAMLAGNAATSIRFTVPQLPVMGGFRSTRLLPATVDGPAPPANAPLLFFRPVEALQDLGNQVDRLEIYEMVPDFVGGAAMSTFGLVQTLTPADFAMIPCSPGVRDCIEQQGTTSKVDALSGRSMRRLQYRNFGTHETLLTNESVNAGGGNGGVRWWELRRTGLGAGWSIFQEGTYAPDDQSRWMASMAMNGEGEIGLGFSLSGSSNFPSLGYTLRRPIDPAGTFPNGEVIAATGVSAQTATTRWGDYSALNVDPSDDATFWYTTQYSGNRLTRILSFGQGIIFADNFETGDTSAWSNVLP